MDFDEIAEQQGWDTITMLQLCRQVISLIGAQDALDGLAQSIADIENAADQGV